MKYYLIGIKGSGLSSLAIILKNLGHEVAGYDDEKKYKFTQDKLKGIKIYNQDNDYLKEGVIVIYSSAIKDTHKELTKAKELNLSIYEYMEFLGNLTKDYKLIAVAGTHGKTTTTSMLSTIINPIYGCNYLIGDGSGYASKENDYFLIEACEFKRNFLHYHPKIGVITNVDLDHIGYYKDIDDVKKAFLEFANNCQDLVVIYADEDNSKVLETKTKVIYYGLHQSNDVYATNIKYSESGINFSVYINKDFFFAFSLPFYGEHNLLNSLAVISVCNYLHIRPEDIQKYLSRFLGATRRFKEVRVGNNIIIDDYAHHPKEIKATIEAARQKYPQKKIIAVLEPHTFDRVKVFHKGFAASLNTADISYVLDIYSPDNSLNYPGISVELILQNTVQGHYLKRDCQALRKYKDSVILFMSPRDTSDLIAKCISFFS